MKSIFTYEQEKLANIILENNNVFPKKIKKGKESKKLYCNLNFILYDIK